MTRSREELQALLATAREEAIQLESAYEPFDQRVKLGRGQWKLEDETVISWVEAHGHDPRLKCYPEFGCQVIGATLANLTLALADALDATIPGPLSPTEGGVAPTSITLEGQTFDLPAAIAEIERLRDALRGNFARTTPSAAGRWYTLSSEGFHAWEDKVEDAEDERDAALITVQAAYNALHSGTREEAAGILHDRLNNAAGVTLARVQAEALRTAAYAAATHIDVGGVRTKLPHPAPVHSPASRAALLAEADRIEAEAKNA